MNMKPWLVLLAAAAFFVAPFVSPPFMGYAPEMFPVVIDRPYIQPAGYAFSIWGLIYTWLAVHAVFGLMKRPDDPAWDVTRLPLAGSAAMGAVWLAIAGVAPVTATVVIWVMLGLALLAFLRADPARDRWLLVAPIAIYTGWLSAAASVSLGVILAGYGWLSNTGSAVVMLALVLVVGALVQLRKRGVLEYGATVIWALIGVIAANWGDAGMVAYVAAAGIAVMAGTMVLARR
jgi:hypothetical protein